MTPPGGFTLSPAAPFRLDLTTLVLRRAPANVVDRWEPPTYRRVFVLGGAPIEAVVEQTAPPAEPRLSVEVGRPTGEAGGLGGPARETGARLRGPAAARGAPQQLAPLLRATLGLDVDLAPFYRLASEDEQLAPLASRFSGLKPPMLPTVFEALCSGIACQQLSLVAGMHLLARLAEAHGTSLAGRHAFPDPDDLVEAAPQDLRRLGFSLRKSETILRLAREAASGRLDLEGLREQGSQEAVRRLVALPGVGRWTAQYVALRGLGRLDVFPVDDVGAQNKLQRFLDLDHRPDAEETGRIAARWRPYEGLLYFHLLLDSLERGGALPQAQPCPRPRTAGVLRGARSGYEEGRPRRKEAG